MPQTHGPRGLKPHTSRCPSPTSTRSTSRNSSWGSGVLGVRQQHRTRPTPRQSAGDAIRRGRTGPDASGAIQQRAACEHRQESPGLTQVPMQHSAEHVGECVRSSAASRGRPPHPGATPASDARTVPGSCGRRIAANHGTTVKNVRHILEFSGATRSNTRPTLDPLVDGVVMLREPGAGLFDNYIWLIRSDPAAVAVVIRGTPGRSKRNWSGWDSRSAPFS